MLTHIDSLNYNPCENHVEPTIDSIIKNYDESRRNERMFFYGDEETDFLGIGYDEDEMKLIMSSEPVEAKFDEKAGIVVA